MDSDGKQWRLYAIRTVGHKYVTGEIAFHSQPDPLKLIKTTPPVYSRLNMSVKAYRSHGTHAKTSHPDPVNIKNHSSTAGISHPVNIRTRADSLNLTF